MRGDSRLSRVLAAAAPALGAAGVSARRHVQARADDPAEDQAEKSSCAAAAHVRWERASHWHGPRNCVGNPGIFFYCVFLVSI